jgi:hypothetical protein
VACRTVRRSRQHFRPPQVHSSVTAVNFLNVPVEIPHGAVLRGRPFLFWRSRPERWGHTTAFHVCAWAVQGQGRTAHSSRAHSGASSAHAVGGAVGTRPRSPIFTVMASPEMTDSGIGDLQPLSGEGVSNTCIHTLHPTRSTSSRL